MVLLVRTVVLGLLLLVTGALAITHPIPGGTASMFFRDPEQVVIASPLSGHITYNGTPAAGATVTRHLVWKDEAGEDETTVTDETGYFELPVKTDVVKISKISQFVMSQKIYVDYQGREYLVWAMGKGSKEMYGELGGEPVNLSCELTADDTPMRLEDALLVTKCRWDSLK